MYAKEAISIEHQIRQLVERGLEINEANNAEHYLSNISYYRLSGYWLPMQADKEKHIFKANSRFSDVIALYNFDRELRLLLFEYQMLYIHLCCMKYLLNAVNPGNRFTDQLSELFSKYPKMLILML